MADEPTRTTRERVLRGAAQKHCEACKLLQNVSQQRCIHVGRLGSDELIRYVEALEWYNRLRWPDRAVLLVANSVKAMELEKE
jgi:hypothetical protein